MHWRIGLPIVLAVLATTPVSATTLDDIRARGELRCGVNDSNPAFAYPDSQGEMRGFDVDFCRATAAAIGVPVKFVLLTGTERFPALQSGEVDLLYRSTTWTIGRDVNLGFDYQGINWYDGQGFMVRKSMGIASALELDGAAVCVVAGSTTELNVADYFRSHGMSFTPVVFEKAQDVRNAYDAGRCDVYTNEHGNLAAQRIALKDPAEHMILPELISKEPFGPVTREGDDQWGDIVRWVLYATINAEEKGITQANVEELRDSATDPEVQRLLGATGTFGEDMGLANDWGVQALKASGNYAEIFERNMGMRTPIRLERGPNRLWTDGGLLYAPPVR
jgi:general L-amino acid transport system substrate-binding protein